MSGRSPTDGLFASSGRSGRLSGATARREPPAAPPRGTETAARSRSPAGKPDPPSSTLTTTPHEDTVTDQQPRLLTEIPGPRSRALVAAEAPYLAPGIQSIATLSGLAVARGEGSRDRGRRRQPLPRHRRRHLRQRPRPRPPALPPDPEGPDRRGHGGLAHHRPPRRGPHEGGLAHPAGPRRRSSSTRAGPRRSRRRCASPSRYTKKFEFLSFWGGFHGKTAGTLSLIGDGTKNHLGPLAARHATTRRTPTATAARSGSSTPPAASSARSSRARSSSNSTTGALAAILIEPIQGTAGNVVPPPEFMPAIRDIAKENDALLISDEMISGFGRTGTLVRLRALGRRARRRHHGQGPRQRASPSRASPRPRRSRRRSPGARRRARARATAATRWRARPSSPR